MKESISKLVFVKIAALQPSALSLLVACGATLPGASEAGDLASNALRVAAREGRKAEVAALLERGADVNAPGPYGETALINAAFQNAVSIARLLLARGANPDARDDREETALMKAAKTCSPQISGDILDRQPNVNLTNRDGRTALIHAAAASCPQIIRQLVRVPGIDINAKDDSGKTALDYSLEEAVVEVGGPNTEAARTLMAHGAKTAKYTIIPRKKSPPAIIEAKP